MSVTTCELREDSDRRMRELVAALAVKQADGVPPWDAVQDAFESAWGRRVDLNDAHDIMLCQAAVNSIETPLK